MENKLKQSIQEIQDEEFANVVIIPSTDKLYGLIEDVVVGFNSWAASEGEITARGMFYFNKTPLKFIPIQEAFNYFIENVYKQ